MDKEANIESIDLDKIITKKVKDLMINLTSVIREKVLYYLEEGEMDFDQRICNIESYFSKLNEQLEGSE